MKKDLYFLIGIVCFLMLVILTVALFIGLIDPLPLNSQENNQTILSSKYRGILCFHVFVEVHEISLIGLTYLYGISTSVVFTGYKIVSGSIISKEEDFKDNESEDEDFKDDDCSSKDVHIRYLSTFFDCLAHPNLSVILATDQK